MTDDIVTRLRAPDGRFLVAKLQNEAADEIERLRKERDEARKIACGQFSLRVQPPWGSPNNLVEQERFAKFKKWDCFKEVTDGRG